MTPEFKKQCQDTLRKAKEQLLANGLWRDHKTLAPSDVYGKCSENARCTWLYVSDNVPPYDAKQTIEAISGALNRVIGTQPLTADLIPIYRWNDRPERTIEDIAAAYDRAVASFD